LANIDARVNQKKKHRLRRQLLLWLRHCSSAFKVSAKNGLFLGQMARTPFVWSLKGYIRNDPRINHFLRLKTLAVSGLSCLLLLAVEKKSVRQYGCCLKKGMDAGVRSTFLTIKFNRI
jgi:hypothetical protein